MGFLIKAKVHSIKALMAVALCYLNGFVALSQSKAHDASRFAIIDPAYQSVTGFPASNLSKAKTCWIYGPAELECHRLQALIDRKDSAKLNVGYTGVFHKPYKEGSYRLRLKNPLIVNAVSFKAAGLGKVYINNALESDFAESDSVQTLKLKKSRRVSEVQFDLWSSTGPPALLVETKYISTSENGWQWKAPDGDWQDASYFPQNTANLPPHKLEDPTVTVKPTGVKNNVYDFGRELFGYIIIQSNNQPIFGAGESEPEAVDLTPKTKEQSVEVSKLSNGLWKTKHPVAFRFVFLENNGPDNLWAEAIFRPVTYKGAFACSDSLLTKVWMNSAYTLRLCMHDFLLDGVKRDRLPWAGDLTMSSLVNAYTFYDKEIVRRSLVALGREGIKETDINGIVDFSLLWIISQDQYQLYFGDLVHLRQEWKRIKETLNLLKSTSDTAGFLVPRKGTRLFLDWVRQEKWTALQILWWWAQKSAVKLAERMGDTETASQWTKSADRLASALKKAAWSKGEQRWLSNRKTISDTTRHPNFLAVVSGLADENQYAGIKSLLQDEKVKRVGSPYMAGFEVMALSRLGDVDYMLRHVTDYWGGMLNRGATTFWEAFDTKESKSRQYSFYNRPYGKSLCHAWSSGPAAFLPAELFGLKPTEDGWKRFTLRPKLGSLAWASVSVPTNYGSITVDVEGMNMRVVVPKGTTLEWKGKAVSGPYMLQEKL